MESLIHDSYDTVTVYRAQKHSCQDTEGVDLYKGAFSLAYGTLTLLRDAKMHLKRNRGWAFGGMADVQATKIGIEW
jgi:hypothetical protein